MTTRFLNPLLLLALLLPTTGCSDPPSFAIATDNWRISAGELRVRKGFLEVHSLRVTATGAALISRVDVTLSVTPPQGAGAAGTGTGTGSGAGAEAEKAEAKKTGATGKATKGISGKGTGKEGMVFTITDVIPRTALQSNWTMADLRKRVVIPIGYTELKVVVTDSDGCVNTLSNKTHFANTDKQ